MRKLREKLVDMFIKKLLRDEAEQEFFGIINSKH